jgi:DNA excision repair protein ERCC-6
VVFFFFLVRYGLLHSNLLKAPTLLVCPATVMKQWISELHKWAPPFRVFLIHSSNSKKGEDGMSYSKDLSIARALKARGHAVIVTTYEGLRRNKDSLVKMRWAYCILDEVRCHAFEVFFDSNCYTKGHKIRNPDADITLTCKQLQSQHRIVLTGTPIQNSLKELWSLLDFVYPGKLGTLPIFQREFEVPKTKNVLLLVFC